MGNRSDALTTKLAVACAAATATLVGAAASSAPADDFQWTRASPTSSAWTTLGNWQENAIPASGNTDTAFTCAHCGRPVTGEIVTKRNSGKQYTAYYRCSRYVEPGHPRVRLREEEIDHQVVALFEKMRQSMYADCIFPDLSFLERWEFQGSHPNISNKVQTVR